tara:strand:- start:315 stop:632 length:318 start_codon:yes stop_codon:yes gene_type:complete
MKIMKKVFTKHLHIILLVAIVSFIFFTGYSLLTKKTCEGLENDGVGDAGECDESVCVTIQENRENLNALEIVYNDVKKIYEGLKGKVVGNEKQISHMYNTLHEKE